MKYFFTVYLLLFVIIANAQESVIFRQAFLPDKTYISETKMIQSSKATASGSSEIIAEMEKQGFSFPRLTKSEMTVQATMTTETEKDGIIPFEIKYDNFSSKYFINDEEIKIPNLFNNAKMKGTISEGIKLKVQSTEGIDVNETFQQALVQSVEKLTQNIEFPDKPINVGDHFSMSVPMQIPMPGLGNLDFEIKMDYTFIKIQNGIADFDFIQTLTSKSDNRQFELLSTGSGKGSLKFELAENFITSMDSILDIKIDIKFSEQLHLSTEVNSESQIHYIIR